MRISPGTERPSLVKVLPTSEISKSTEGLLAIFEEALPILSRLSSRALPLALYPLAPQFLEATSGLSECLNFYIIRNGIHWTGAPSWKNVSGENEIRKLTAFLARVNDLQSAVTQEGKASPPAGPAAPSMKLTGANRHE